MHVLFGSDLSVGAQAAGTAAAVLAARFQQPLVLAHVRADWYGAPLTEEEDPSPRTATLKELLVKERARLEALGPRVSERVLSGMADEELVALADPRETTLVVVGSLGHRAPLRWILGSTADRVAQTSRVPVLVVRDDRSIAEWAEGRRPLRVFLGLSFSSVSDAAVDWLRGFVKLGPCDVVIGHSYWPYEEYRRFGIPDAVDLRSDHPEVQALLSRRMEERVGELPGAQSVRFVAEGRRGFAASHLIGMAETSDAELVIVGTHQRQGSSRLWHRSISRGVLHGTSFNVVCVPHGPDSETHAARLPKVDRVLVTTDLSAVANHAIPHAYAIVERCGTVHLAHIAELPGVPNPLYAHYSPRRGETAEERARRLGELEERLRALVPREAVERGIRTEIEVFEARDVAAGICALAERINAGIVCLCSHGRSGLSRAVAGSVAHEVLRQLQRPLLLVRRPAEP